MANEIQCTHDTGSTVYAIVRDQTGQVWSTVGSSFGSYSTGSIGDYDVTMSEQGTASGYFTGNFPSSITAGVYNVVTYDQAGGSPAEGDTVIAEGTITWDGSAVYDASDITTSGIADAVWDEQINSHTTSGSAGHAIRPLGHGTATAGAASTITLGPNGSGTDDIYNGLTVDIVHGTGAGQSRTIDDYVGSSTLATVDTAWDTTPDTSSKWVLRMAAGGGGGASASAIADAVWDESTSGHTTAGTFGEQLATDVDAILADTNELQTDWADGGRLDLLIDAITADTNELQTDWTDGGRLDLLIDNIGTDTDAIVADTNELQTDWADGGRLDLLIDAITADTNELQTDWADGGRLDLLIDGIGTDTDAILADTNELQTDWTDGGRLDLLLDAISASAIADAVWDEATSGHTTSGTFGEQLATDVDAILADTNELQTDWADGGRLDLIIDSILSGLSTIVLTSTERNAIADALLDRTDGVETDYTVRGAMRLMLAAQAGLCSITDNTDGTFNVIYRDMADSKNRLDATTDKIGRRTVVNKDTL